MKALGLSALLALAASARAGECAATKRARPMMATYVAVTVCGEGPKVDAAVRDAFAEMQRLADLLSEWLPDSAVSKVSAQAGVAPVPVPPELFDVLVAGKAASAATAGAFDVTWAALAGLWHFDGRAELPSVEDLARQRALVGDADLVLDAKARTAFLRRKGMRLGLGGLAKGYVAQAGADLLVARGFPNVLVAASGDITARGQNGDRPFTVAIQDPRRTGQVVATLALVNASVSTAGDYEHAFFLGGRRFHHILNPRTGEPASGAASVSVLSKRGVWADALDTGLLVLGVEEGAKAANELADIGALLIDDQGLITRAGPLGARFEVGPTPAPPRADSALSP